MVLLAKLISCAMSDLKRFGLSVRDGMRLKALMADS
jgi:hypothetical protein